MQTLQIITTLMSIMCYGALTFLASFAFVRLRRLSNEVGRLHHDVHTTLCIIGMSKLVLQNIARKY